MWRRANLDLLLVVMGGFVFWHSASTGYQVVLAPEGVAATAVDYTAFLAPLCIWTGVGLLVLRLADRGIGWSPGALAPALGPIAGSLARPAAASISRQHRRLAVGVALLTLAISFATAVAIFDTTYNAQALVDARLTNGADVTVTGTGATRAGARLAEIRATAGVVAAEPMQHRYAYVGNDLQDLYGIDAARIGEATSIADAYFGNRDARATMARLAGTPDGLLVSQETVDDFQLAVGDTVNLRLMSAADRQYHVVPFRFTGVVTEFPTAPRDSFLVANAAYVATATGDAGAEIVLVRSDGEPRVVARELAGALGVGAGLAVHDLDEAARLIGSSLTAVDLRALTAIELVFAMVLAAMSAGLVLWLGAGERARASAVLALLGARPRAIRAFLWGEAAIILVAGLVLGSALGGGVAFLLVRVLGGVFDPPPDSLSIPWLYLTLVAAGATLAIVAAVGVSGPGSRSRAVQTLREIG
jgi:putative ABC transport system permease protein